MKPPCAEQLFARLARLLPRGFAAEYGADMMVTFARRAAAARGCGRLHFLLFMLRELAGLARAVVVEQADARRANVSVPPSPEREALSSIEHLMREARHAMRRLIRTPGFTTASVFTLALAIGANTAIFTLLHRVVLSPLPYPASERVVALDHAALAAGLPSGIGMTPGLYREYSKLPSVEGIALYYGGETTLSGAGEAERLESLHASPSLGSVLGVQPALGRWFTRAEGEPGGLSVAVLTHAFWVRRFGASPAALGSTIRLAGTSYEVIGVMPPGFAFPDERAQLILPLRLNPTATSLGGFYFQGIARLRPGVSVEDARREQDAVIADLPARFPGDVGSQRTLVGESKLRALTQPLKDQMLGNTAETLWVLLGSVAIVLLIACANLANLFLVRMDSRQREVALRRALGADTTQVATYFVVEALLVAVVSGGFGLLLGSIAVDVLVLSAPIELPRLHEVRIDGVVAGFTALATLLAGLSLGLMPFARRLPAISSVLQDAGHGNTASGNRMHTRQALMAMQVALAVVLLVAAGLMVQSFQGLRNVDAGFRAESRLVFRVGLESSAYETDESAVAFHELLLEGLRGLPGVRQVALTTILPLDAEGGGPPLDVRGRPQKSGEVRAVTRFRRVSTDYFATMAIPLRRGRLLDAGDVSGTTNAALIDEALAKLYFPMDDAIGKQIRRVGGDDEDGWLTVVGIVGNTATYNLREDSPTAKVYLPLRSKMSRGTPSTHGAAYVLRTNGDPIALVSAVTRTLHGLNPNVAMARPELLANVVARARAGLAFAMVLLALAAAVALLLGLVGVYAVISYGVAQRTREIGVRLALGARPIDVTGMIVRRSGGVIAVGVLLGIVAAVASSRLLQALLFGVARDDMLTYTVVALGTFGVAMLACWLPAKRAARLNPLDSLRR